MTWKGEPNLKILMHMLSEIGKQKTGLSNFRVCGLVGTKCTSTEKVSFFIICPLEVFNNAVLEKRGVEFVDGWCECCASSFVQSICCSSQLSQCSCHHYMWEVLLLLPVKVLWNWMGCILNTQDVFQQCFSICLHIPGWNITNQVLCLIFIMNWRFELIFFFFLNRLIRIFKKIYSLKLYSAVNTFFCPGLCLFIFPTLHIQLLSGQLSLKSCLLLPKTHTFLYVLSLPWFL